MDMDLILDEEQIEFQQTFRKFCEQEIAPLADCIEAEGIQNEVYRKLGSAGYLGLLHPEQYGGQGASFLTAVLAQSALAYHCGSTFFSSGASAGLAGLPISHFGSEEQKARFLPGLISGQSVGCLAVTESGSGSDVASIATTLKRQPAGLLLNGNKAYITNAPNADFALVLARYCRDGQIPSGASGLTLCIVDLHSAGVS